MSYIFLFHCYVIVFYCYISNSHICCFINGLIVNVSVSWLRVEVIAQAPTCCMQNHSLGVMFSFSVVNEAWQLQLIPLIFCAQFLVLQLRDYLGMFAGGKTTTYFDLQFSSHSFALSSKFK